MSETLNILIPYGYEAPTDADIKAAKKWTNLRNDNAAMLSSLIESLLQDAIKELTKLGYKYNCKPEEFKFSQDKNLREEVAQVMDDLEDDILSLVEEYSLNATEDKERRSNILPWLLALHSKNAKNLAGTLHERVRQFLFDTEAQIAAMKLAGYNQTKAITRAISTMHAVYTAPEVLAAYRKKSAAKYIQSRGVHEGNIGLSSSGAVNIENFGANTAIQSWSHTQYEEAKDEGKAGYYCFRGSTYPCSLCDDVCSVFHTIEEGMVLPVHGHCCCYAVFVGMEGQELETNRYQEYQRLKNSDVYSDVKYNSDNGGLKASHIDHNFDKKGGEYEKHVQNAGYKAGHIVILGAEWGNVIGQRYTEGTWDGMKFEVAGRETATSNNILRGLKHCASKKDTEIAILDYPNGGFNNETLQNAIMRYRGLEPLNDGQYIKFKKIICVQNERIVYEQDF